jgi:hypothetical protein
LLRGLIHSKLAKSNADAVKEILEASTSKLSHLDQLLGHNKRN